MNEIKSLVISLIFTTIAISICELLVPKDSYKNQIRLITGTVMLLSLISPFASGINFDKIDFDISYKDVVISSETEKAVAMSINNDIQEILFKNGINEGKIIIETDFDDQGSIIINKVYILFEEKDKIKSDLISIKLEQIYDFEIEFGDL